MPPFKKKAAVVAEISETAQTQSVPVIVEEEVVVSKTDERVEEPTVVVEAPVPQITERQKNVLDQTVPVLKNLLSKSNIVQMRRDLKEWIIVLDELRGAKIV